MIDEVRNRTLEDEAIAGERRDSGADGGDLREETQQDRESAAQIVDPGDRGQPERNHQSDPEERPAAVASVPQPKREPGCQQDADDGEAAAAGHRADVAGALVGVVHDAVALQRRPHKAGQCSRAGQARAARRERGRETHRPLRKAAFSGPPPSLIPKAPAFRHTVPRRCPVRRTGARPRSYTRNPFSQSRISS